MSGNDRYVTAFSLFSVLWESEDSQGMGLKVGRGLELCPGRPAIVSGTLDPGPQGSVCSEVRNEGALGSLNSSSRMEPL